MLATSLLPITHSVDLVVKPAPTGALHTFTPSMVSLHVDCPRRFAFRYVEKVSADFYPAAFAFGRALHRGMEGYCQTDVPEGNALEHAQACFITNLRKECEKNEVAWDEGEDEASSEVLGLHLLSVFARWCPRNEVTASEIPFDVPIGRLLRGRPQVSLRGRMDLHLEDGAIVELKTSRKGLKPFFLNRSAQLQAYALVARLQDGSVPRMVVVELRKSLDEPTAREHPLQFGDHSFRQFLGRVNALLLSLERGAFPRRRSPLCAWCEYRSHCDGGKG